MFPTWESYPNRAAGVWGKIVMLEALKQAKSAQAAQLTLAIDTRNRPAWNLYRGLGFQPIEQREVYLAVGGSLTSFPRAVQM